MMDHYFVKWLGNDKDGRWNVIQVIGDNARYFVLKGSLEEANPLPFLSHGWIEDGGFQDDEDFIPLGDWDRYEGVLISF